MDQQHTDIPEKIVINKAKLKKSLKLSVKYTKYMPGNVVLENSTDFEQEAHQDLKMAYKALGVHLSFIAEQFDKDGLNVKGIECTGFSIKGEEENEGVVLTGHRLLSTGSALIINTPFMLFSSDAYKGMKHLMLDLDKCKNEIMLALFDNKYLGCEQGDLFG